MKKIIAPLIVTFSLTTVPAFADEIEDILQGALEAYRDGDAKLAKEEVEYALELLKSAEGKGLQALLPEPMDGWTMELTDDSQGFAMLGGAGASAEYSNTAGDKYFNVTIATSPQIAGTFGAMFGSIATMGAMGELIRIQREKFVISDGQIQGLVDKRIYVNFEGEDIDAMRAHLESMDIKALKDF